MSILILNGSPSGSKGNCEVLIRNLSAQFKRDSDGKKEEVQVVHLTEIKWTAAETKKVFAIIEKAHGFIFVTGTYWDSWGSPLQMFLENVTPLEGRPAFLGKPAVVLVLNHSVGGKGVLSRLQGVLSTLGCLIPPMSGMVYSWVSQQALKKASVGETQSDLWSLEDLTQILENFKKALQIKVKWTSWPVDRNDYRKIWLSDGRKDSKQSRKQFVKPK